MSDIAKRSNATAEDIILMSKMKVAKNSYIDYYMIQNCSTDSTKRIPTMGTDCISKIFYNNEFVLKTYNDEIYDTHEEGISAISSILMHEGRHVILNHGDTRRGRFKMVLWNCAADFFINKSLHDEDAWFIKGGSFSIQELIKFAIDDEYRKQLSGSKCLLDLSIDVTQLSTEDIYNMLVDEFDKQMSNMKCKSDDESSDEESDDADSDGNGDGNADGENSEGDSDGNGGGGSPNQQSTKGENKPNKKSGNYRNKLEEELESKLSDAFDGDKSNAMNGNDFHQDEHQINAGDGYYEEIQASTMKKLQDAIEQAKGRGFEPGSFMSRFSFENDYLIPWNKQLRKYVNHITKDERSFSRISRPMMVRHGLVYPGKYSNKIEHLHTSLDTSGSMYNVLSHCITEMYGLAKEVKAEKLVIDQVDTHITETITLGPRDKMPKDFIVKGLGGTDFRPSFEKLKKQKIEPTVFVYFTDGECNFPERPRYHRRVIWVIYNNREITAPWGKTIHMSKDFYS